MTYRPSVLFKGNSGPGGIRTHDLRLRRLGGIASAALSMLSYGPLYIYFSLFLSFPRLFGARDLLFAVRLSKAPLEFRARSAVVWIRQVGAFSYVDLAVKAYDLVG